MSCMIVQNESYKKTDYIIYKKTEYIQYRTEHIQF